jgi:hypothetical protein
VFIWTLCLKVSEKNRSCCQRDCNSCQRTIVCFCFATSEQHLCLCIFCELHNASSVQYYHCTIQFSMNRCLLHSMLTWMNSDGVEHLCPSGGAVRVFVGLFCWHHLPFWLQPRTPYNSRPFSFHLDSEMSRTLVSKLLWPLGPIKPLTRLRHPRFQLC